MKSKNYYVIDSLQHDLEYIITEDHTDEGTEYRLFRSMASQWSENAKGELLVALTDDGDGYQFKFKPREKKRLDYDEIEWVYLLTDFIRRQDNPIIYNVVQYE